MKIGHKKRAASRGSFPVCGWDAGDRRSCLLRRVFEPQKSATFVENALWLSRVFEPQKSATFVENALWLSRVFEPQKSATFVENALWLSRVFEPQKSATFVENALVPPTATTVIGGTV